jgi:hypothetical protein
VELTNLAMIALVTTPLVMVSYLIAGKLMPKDNDTNFMWSPCYNFLASVILFVIGMVIVAGMILIDSLRT